ncbi:hypothetical protein V8D89_003461 [Ganoderma adspersum]
MALDFGRLRSIHRKEQIDTNKADLGYFSFLVLAYSSPTGCSAALLLCSNSGSSSSSGSGSGSGPCLGLPVFWRPLTRSSLRSCTLVLVSDWISRLEATSSRASGPRAHLRSLGSPAGSLRARKGRWTVSDLVSLSTTLSGFATVMYLVSGHRYK